MSPVNGRVVYRIGVKCCCNFPCSSGSHWPVFTIAPSGGSTKRVYTKCLTDPSTKISYSVTHHMWTSVIGTEMSFFCVNDVDTFKHIKQDRDIDRVHQRYMQLAKPELVELLIRMEQYIAYQNKYWLKSEFEKYINE